MSRAALRRLGRIGAVLVALASGGPAGAQTFPLVGARPAGARAVSPHGEIAVACEACHTATAWTPVRGEPDFDHARQTGFALDGRHAAAECASCHLDLRFDEPGGASCASCHLDVHGGTLGATCQTCHGTTDFGEVRGAAVHARTSFPLTGAHGLVACTTCHAAGAGGALGAAFGPLPSDCASCHADEAAATAGGPVDHVAAGFPADCETCHTTVAFGGAGFEHAAASGGFELVGAHIALPCSACHTAGLGSVFQPAGQDDCLTCHADDASSATPSHAGFPTTCTECHGTTAWTGAAFDHTAVSGGFALAGAHTALACQSCHSGPDNALPWTPAGPADCQSCHAADAAAAPIDHTDFPTTCTECHGIETWAGATADHVLLSGGFPLVGAHLALACQACHTGPDMQLPWAPAGADDCQSCHADDAAAVVTPSHTNFPTTCTECHGTTTWAGATFDHVAASEGFALVGAHGTLACATCHSGPGGSLPWTPVNQDDCQSCHAEDAAAATPNHAGFPATCVTCHSPATWSGATVDHPALSGGFGLVGAHNALACATCHSGPNNEVPWTPVDQGDCQSCHADDASSATPSHSGFPATCETCHGTTTWSGAAVDHPALSGGFALVGAHAVLACAACHTGPGNEVPWAPTSQDDCQSCHAEDAAGATPDHTNFSTTCTECHSTTAWTGAAFDHVTASGGFGLVGAHGTLACASCHSGPGGSLPWTPANQDDCQSCHAEDAAEATPSHAGFPATCATCHTATTWSGATVDHPALSGGFALLGAHGALACQTCHSGPGNEVPWDPAGQDDCQSCHAADAPSAPIDHAQLPPTCQTCHGTTTWAGATADHVVLSGGFALVGAHVSIACTACHTGPANEVPWNPSGQDDCQGCHAEDAAAASPSHAGFPATCTTCHSTATWGGATVDHPALSGGFGLVGAHAVLACQSCHSGPDNEVPWTPADQNDCQSCHAEDAAGATPSHTGFPSTCTSCHGTGTWAGATVDHVAVSGGFALVGAHNALACQTCHSGPGGALPWTPANQDDCFACHASDYQSVHAGSGFPTTCDDCHSTTTWGGATFDHDGFPIYSGEHEGEWASCQTCHTQPGQPQVFTCVTCHEHRRSEMDDEHEDEDDYVYNSQACYNCHPDGEDRGSFDLVPTPR